MNQEVEAWPFLVSANLYLDYRTIVAPDFMCDAQVTSLLARNAGGDLIEHQITYLTDKKVGDLTLIFRVVEAISEELNIEGNGVLKDSFGREIYLIEGLVIRRKYSNLKLSQEQFDKLHNQLKENYQTFWELITPQPAISSNKDYYIFEKNVEEINDDSNQVNSPLAHLEILQWNCQNSSKLKAEIFSLVISNDSTTIGVKLKDKSQSLALYNLNSSSDNFSLNEQSLFKHQISLTDKVHTPVIFNSYNNTFITGIVDYGSQFIKGYSLNQTESIFSIKLGWFEAEVNINTLACANNDSLLILGCDDGKLIFYDLESASKIQDPLEHQSSIKALAVDATKKQLASADSKGTIIIWNLELKAKTEFCNNAHGTPHESSINSLVYSPDGNILVSAGDDNKIKFWNPNTLELIANFREHLSPINCIVFSPDGNLLASGDDEGYIRIWNVKTKEYIELKEHQKGVTTLGFTSEGKTLISGSKDKTIRVWKKC